MKTLVFVWTIKDVAIAVIVVWTLCYILAVWIRAICESIFVIPEKRKDEFVSGHFIICKKSFKQFRKGEGYWLEYTGKNTYIGRSDNVLNQRIHIRPRELKNFDGWKKGGEK